MQAVMLDTYSTAKPIELYGPPPLYSGPRDGLWSQATLRDGAMLRLFDAIRDYVHLAWWDGSSIGLTGRGLSRLMDPSGAIASASQPTVSDRGNRP